MGNVILGWLQDAAYSVWAWLLSVSFGFIPTWALMAVVVAAVAYLYFRYGMRGLVGGAITILASFELMRRFGANKREGAPDNPKSKSWPEYMPRPSKPIGKGKRRFNPDTNEWESLTK